MFDKHADFGALAQPVIEAARRFTFHGAMADVGMRVEAYWTPSDAQFVHVRAWMRPSDADWVSAPAAAAQLDVSAELITTSRCAAAQRLTVKFDMPFPLRSLLSREESERVVAECVRHLWMHEMAECIRIEGRCVFGNPHEPKGGAR